MPAILQQPSTHAAAAGILGREVIHKPINDGHEHFHYDIRYLGDDDGACCRFQAERAIPYHSQRTLPGPSLRLD